LSQLVKDSFAIQLLTNAYRRLPLEPSIPEADW
jgi:hypothetical protein